MVFCGLFLIQKEYICYVKFPLGTCEPRKTSKGKLSYRFWKESWYIYFSGLKQSPSVSFQQYSPFLLRDWLGWLMGWERRERQAGLREDRHIQGTERWGIASAFPCVWTDALTWRWWEIRLSSVLWELLENTGMKCSAAEEQSVPRETLCCRGCVCSCAQASRAGQEGFSCEEAKHPVPLCTPLLSFLAKQDLIIITRTQTLVVHNDVFCGGILLYCSLF